MKPKQRNEGGVSWDDSLLAGFNLYVDSDASNTSCSNVSSAESDVLPDLTSASDSTPVSGLTTTDETDSGNSECQYGNPFSSVVVGDEPHVVVGVSYTDEEVVEWNMSTTSDETQHNSDEGLGMGVVGERALVREMFLDDAMFVNVDVGEYVVNDGDLVREDIFPLEHDIRAGINLDGGNQVGGARFPLVQGQEPIVELPLDEVENSNAEDDLAREDDEGCDRIHVGGSNC